ncbi:MAG TPA: hypothetical protein PLU27_13170 [Ginsengibacter sp.]|nr:hypothetical protein [Ginsengibacter sp.]
MKQIYVLLVMASLLFVGCSSSYRTMQTPDDVYYSPGISADNEEYVNLSNRSDGDRYYDRNGDYLEDLEIRRAIRNPIYRPSISLGFNIGSPYYGFGSPFYSPFGSPFYSPFSYSYSPLYGAYYNPFSPFSMGYTGFLGNSFGYNPYGYAGYYGYNPVVAGYYTGHSYYPGYNTGIGIIRNRDNGPRTGNTIRIQPQNSTPGVAPRTGSNGATIAPVRTMISSGRNTGIRSELNNSSVDRRSNNVLRKIFSPANSGSRDRDIFRSDRRSNSSIFIPNERSSNNNRVETNTRTFERNNNTTPPSTNNSRSNNSSTPIRKF